MRSPYLQAIRRAYAALMIQSAKIIDGGQYNDVLLVNEELIFRFPRFAEGVEKLAMETAILRGIQGRISLSVPNPFYTSFEPEAAGQAFMGYAMIAGEPLLRETLAAIEDESTLERLAAQLAGFLHELHAVPYRDVIAYDLPVLDYAAYWQGLYQRIQAKVFAQMSPQGRSRASREFETFLEDRRNFAFQPVLVHSDAGSSNILWNPREGAITGIIDFGFCHAGDPARDFAVLLTYGEPFLQRVLRFYPEAAAMLDRIRFYRGTFPLQAALYGIEHDDAEEFAWGIAGYR